MFLFHWIMFTLFGERLLGVNKFVNKCILVADFTSSDFRCHCFCILASQKQKSNESNYVPDFRVTNGENLKQQKSFKWN